MITFVDVMMCQFKSLITLMKIDIALLEWRAEISKTQIRIDKVFFFFKLAWENFLQLIL